MQTIKFIIFWEFFMVEQIFLLFQVKWNVIINNRLAYTSASSYQVIKLSRKLHCPRHFHRWADLSAHTRKKRKQKNFMELLPSNQPSSRNENFVSTSKNLQKKQKLIFSRSVQFHMKTTVCLKYFVNDCKLRKTNPVGTRPKMNVFFTFKIGPFVPIKKGRLLDVF